ncbi:hypothetical protein HanRHA438_Chr16g0758141 [Helianthus annuus]|nr:hypothetical protein HanOQP8_Chr16g0614941 [Helianthus annuus]KAJ0681505.1 hypothetical protein HanPI659440_Chr16g0636741 [Helianthus annuus]KAJ0821059.1 hypothetical protein HanPSC8_Chr16g0715531 [Helianthus annuus]KAJ0835681.1 hypothetical protein HanRHA438_Chr16g0758141 [Helianthus annuus]
MSNSGRIRARKDRFYSPPAMRRYNQQQQQQQKHKQQVEQPKHREKTEKSERWMSINSGSSAVVTNLDRFMKHTTPVVTAQHFPKTSMKGWRNREDDYHPYFLLGDLWESFKEWSAYGVGVPLVLNERDSVVQYYAPSLSAIQLYVDPTAPTTSIRRAGEDSDYESSSGDGSSYEAGGPAPVAIKDSDEGVEIRNPPGLLVLEYFERASPFQREPLASKISDLEFKFPELNTYRSCDLTQSSWISVAWYPIYRIPVGPSLQNVDTSFLTFHSLSTPLRSTDGNGVHPRGSTAREVHEARMPCQLSLQIFGMAVYKFKDADWTKDGVHGTEKINSLIKSTDNWLRNLDVHHPDYMFFKNH